MESVRTNFPKTRKLIIGLVRLLGSVEYTLTYWIRRPVFLFIFWKLVMRYSLIWCGILILFSGTFRPVFGLIFNFWSKIQFYDKNIQKTAGFNVPNVHYIALGCDFIERLHFWGGILIINFWKLECGLFIPCGTLINIFKNWQVVLLFEWYSYSIGESNLINLSCIT